MNALKMMAIVMMVAGTQGLVYGGFYYFNAIDSIAAQSHEATNTVALMPSWAGLTAVTIGGILFLLGRKRRRDPTNVSHGRYSPSLAPPNIVSKCDR